ncbi:MAG: hypothetical protein ABTQ34_07525 [Bdellovibrionales bacterium]
MLIHTARSAARENLGRSGFPFGLRSRMFDAPFVKGRRITAGFTWMQRMGKGACWDLWFSDETKLAAESALNAGSGLTRDKFPAEWAAVRQFELLQEAGNDKIYDLKVENLTRTLTDLTKSMHGGGYRVTVATLGSYCSEALRDDLEIFDRALQDRLMQMLHFMYLYEFSAERNEQADAALRACGWNWRESLPHIGATFHARRLFKPLDPASRCGRRDSMAQAFFDIIESLPSRHIVDDTSVALELPTATAEGEWIYLPLPGDTYHGFNRFMDDIFRPFDGISLAALDGREGAGREIKACSAHMRGYGDRLRKDSQAHYRRLAQG